MNDLEVEEEIPGKKKETLAQRKLLLAAVVFFFCAVLMIAIVAAVLISENRKQRISHVRQDGNTLFGATVSTSLTSHTTVYNSQDVTSTGGEVSRHSSLRPSIGKELSSNLYITDVVSLTAVFTNIESSSPENHPSSQTLEILTSYQLSTELFASETFSMLNTFSTINPSKSSDFTTQLIPTSEPQTFTVTNAVTSMSYVTTTTDDAMSTVTIETRPTYPPLITLPACGDSEFRCDSGQCVKVGSRCDRVTQCQDKSDEYNCTGCVGFQCSSGLCLWSWTVQCNGQVDCDDLSDEMNCAPIPNQRQCENGLWVAESQWCDGIDSCYDNSDETNCSCNAAYEVQCTNRACVRQEWLCDGYMDCDSDERNCSSCTSEEYICLDYSCINRSQECDGEGQCPGAWDEERCVSLQKGNGTDLSKVQILFKGHNYSVCSTNWTAEWSDAVCRELGHSMHLGTEHWTSTGDETGYLTIQNDSPIHNTPLTSQLVIVDHCDMNKSVHLSCKRDECGRRSTDLMVPYIAGGDLVQNGRWPWVVSLSYLGRPICGGALISDRWVITAGHCVAIPGAFNYTTTPNFIEISLGSVERSRRPRGNSLRLKADLIYHHPDLTWTGLGPIYWDVALVRLERPVRSTSYIYPICLPLSDESFTETDTCYLAGWGYIGFNQASTVQYLREAKLQIWRPEDCQVNTVALETKVDTNFTLCAGYTTGVLSGCQGDSGGPLMCYSITRGRWTLAGVMSSGSNVCGLQSKLANRFTKISAVKDWIKQIHVV